MEVEDEATDAPPEPTETPSEARRHRGILNVSVPDGASVKVNGLRTTSQGTTRRYVSHGLKSGHSYRYVVEATVERNGEMVKETKTALLKAGQVTQIDFDFDPNKLETSLTLHVPENAKVYLSGQETTSNGDTRRFSTKRLAKGEKWGDYVVRVTIDRDGQTLTQEKQVTIAGGDVQALTFDFDKTQLADAR